MKKILLFSIIAISLVYFVYLSIAFIVDYEGIYQKFRKQMAQAGYNIKASHINVERFPLPKIEALDISVDDNFMAKKLEIHFSPLSTLSFKPEVKIIQVDGAKLLLHDTRVNFLSHAPMVAKLIEIAPKMPKVTFNNVAVIDEVTKETTRLNNVFIDPKAPGNQVTFSWDKNSITKVSYTSIDKGVNVQINYSGPTYNMKLSEIYTSGKLKTGTLRYNIRNLQEFMHDRYQDVDLLFTKIKSVEPAEVNCKFVVNTDRVRFSNIKIQSKSIDMYGNIDIYDSEKSDEINLEFEHINLTDLLEAPNMQHSKNAKQKEKLGLETLTRNINLIAKKVNIGNTYVKDFVFQASLARKKMKVNKFKGMIGQGEGEFDASGDITQNQYRSLFDGKVHFEHKDLNMILNDLGYGEYATKKEANFVLTSNIKATPIDYKLNNLLMKIGAFNASGKASVKLIGSVPRINLALSLSALDLFDKDIPVLNNIVKYFSSLTYGMKEKNYLQKFIPLREIRYLGDLDITFNNIMIGNTEVDKLRLITALSPGNIILNSLYYQDEGSYLTGVGYIGAAGIKPKIEFNVAESYLITEKFNFHNILVFLQSLYKEYDMEKVEFKTKFTAQKIKQKDLEFDDFHIKARNNGILWNIESLKGKYAEGSFDASGSLRLDAMNFNLAYAFNDFNLKSVSKLIPFYVFGIEDGWMSMNGMLSTNGSSPDELFYNLYTKSAFLAKNVEWNNFNIDGLIAHTSDATYSKDKLPEDTNYFMSRPKTTMKFLDGMIELDNGLFRISEVDFETNRTKADSDAQFNIYDKKLSINTRFMFRPAASSLYDSRIDVSFPMKVSGILGDSKKEFEFKEFINYLERKEKSKKWIQNQRFPSQELNRRNIKQIIPN